MLFEGITAESYPNTVFSHIRTKNPLMALVGYEFIMVWRSCSRTSLGGSVGTIGIRPVLTPAWPTPTHLPTPLSGDPST